LAHTSLFYIDILLAQKFHTQKEALIFKALDLSVAQNLAQSRNYCGQ